MLYIRYSPVITYYCIYISTLLGWFSPSRPKINLFAFTFCLLMLCSGVKIWCFDNLCRGRHRQIHFQNLPEIALSMLFFNIPARISVSLPFVLNQKSHLIDMHACNHCSAGSRAQTCWAGGPVQIHDKTLTQPSPQAFSARSFLDSTISCDVTQSSRGQRIKRERLGTRLTLTQALTKNW